MKILIHACCADCFLKILEGGLGDEITVYYYNPNIHPRSEFQSRLKAMQLMIGETKMIVADWRPREYFEVIGGDIKKPNRCERCWQLRLEKTAKFAKENGFDGFTSTLVTSEYQNTEMIERIGEEISKRYRIKFVMPKNICKRLETKGFYKQVFCGCCYSLVERFEEKY